MGEPFGRRMKLELPSDCGLYHLYSGGRHNNPPFQSNDVQQDVDDDEAEQIAQAMQLSLASVQTAITDSEDAELQRAIQASMATLESNNFKRAIQETSNGNGKSGKGDGKGDGKGGSSSSSSSSSGKVYRPT